MSVCKIIFLLTVLTLIISAENASQEEPCQQPVKFKNLETLSKYLSCLKQLLGSHVPRYGKRAPSPFFLKLRPNFYNLESNLDQLYDTYEN